MIHYITKYIKGFIEIRREYMATTSISNNICLNCEKYGHHHYQCKIPILSVGIIAFTINSEGQIKYLMIRRRHTLGFVDFVRGKYSIYNKEYILNLFFQMTKKEKEFLLTKDFSELWNYLWNKENDNQYHLLNYDDKKYHHISYEMIDFQICLYIEIYLKNI
jgi:hypothetical protein